MGVTYTVDQFQKAGATIDLNCLLFPPFTPGRDIVSFENILNQRLLILIFLPHLYKFFP
jgi:hypothetical protein